MCGFKEAEFKAIPQIVANIVIKGHGFYPFVTNTFPRNFGYLC